MYQELCGSYSYCGAETTPNHSAEPSMYYSAIINTSIFTLGEPLRICERSRTRI